MLQHLKTTWRFLGLLAHSGEHRTCNAEVAGAEPARSTEDEVKMKTNASLEDHILGSHNGIAHGC